MSAPDLISRLDDSVLEFVGKSACTRPIYGWGWAEGADDRAETVPVEVPNSFSFIVAEFFHWNDSRRGGIGQIEEPGHVYHGYWFLFYTRHVGCFDFLHRIGDYNFHIGRNRPSLYPPSHDPRMAEAWPLPCFPKCSSVWGYGQIAASRGVMEEYEREQKKKWQSEKRT